MAGEQERHELVADLAVAQRGAVLVARLEQQGEQVLAALARGAAAFDLGVDHAVDPPAGALHHRPGGARAAERLEEVVAPVEAERPLELAGQVHVADGAVRVQAEEGAQRDAQGQLAGPALDVDAVPRPPGGEGAIGLLHHRRGRGREVLAMEGGQDDAPGPAVVGAVDGQQAVAEQRDEVAEGALAPAEPVGLGDEDGVVGLRAEGEDDVGVEDPDREDRAVTLVGVEQDGQGIDQHPARADEREPRRPGGQASGHLPLLAQVVTHAQEGVRGQRARRGDRHWIESVIARRLG